MMPEKMDDAVLRCANMGNRVAWDPKRCNDCPWRDEGAMCAAVHDEIIKRIAPPAKPYPKPKEPEPMTDDKAMKTISEIIETGSEVCRLGDGFCVDSPDHPCKNALAHIRARLAQKPKVTREQARGLVIALETFCRESGVPTDKVRELNVPQVFLDILGLEVEEEGKS